jgi:hypothetical protein
MAKSGAHNALLDRIKKSSTIKDSSILSQSRFFTSKDMIQTGIPALNVALSGKLSGGLTPGLTMWAGPSKHFKSMFSLIMAKAYLDKYEDAVLLFYDSEFGTPLAYFNSLNINMNRVVHSPITDIEVLKFDIMKQLTDITREERVIMVVDSLGNLASKKEVEDALSQNTAADMSRPKQIKSLFRMVTPHLTIKDIPLIVVNHTYKEIGLFPKDIVGGGTGSYLSADNIFILGRQQEKEGSDIAGYNFIINVEKSRFVREKSKIPISVKFDGGLSRWSGLLEMALDANVVVKPSNGWYSRVNTTTGEVEDKKFRRKDTDTKEFWMPILQDKVFQDWVTKNYHIGDTSLIEDDTIDLELKSDVILDEVDE